MSSAAPALLSSTTPLQRTLWKVAVAWGLLISILVGATLSASDESSKGVGFGGDFVAFYSAGTFVNQGRASELYDLDALRTFQQELKTKEHLPDSTAKLTPWWNPPVVAMAFGPLAGLQYAQALSIWQVLNGVCVVLSLGLIAHHYLGGLHLRNWKTCGLFALLTTLSCPAYQTFSHGQNTGVTLLLTTSVVVAWSTGRALPAGILAGLLFYKPQHAAILGAALVVALGWRALLGVTMSGLTLLLLNLAALPGTLSTWLTKLPVNLKHLQEDVPYVWDRQVTFKAFWRLALQGTSVGPTATLVTILFISCTLLLGTALVVTCVRAWRADRINAIIGPVLVCTPLLTPFCFDYDLLVLTVPAGLYVADRLGRARLTREDVWTGRAWMALYAWTLVNPGLAKLIEFNGTTLLLGALACLELRRAWDKTSETHVEQPGEVNLRFPSPARQISWSEAA